MRLLRFKAKRLQGRDRWREEEQNLRWITGEDDELENSSPGR